MFVAWVSFKIELAELFMGFSFQVTFFHILKIHEVKSYLLVISLSTRNFKSELTTAKSYVDESEMSERKCLADQMWAVTSN